MLTGRTIRKDIFRIAALGVALLPVTLLHGAQSTASRVEEDISAQKLVRDMVWNEVRSQKGDETYWRYREIDKGNGVTKAFEVDETKGGTARILVALDGQPLGPSQRQRQEAKLQKLLKNPNIARKTAAARHHDGEKERKLLAMLPQAFLFQYDGVEGDLIRVKFRPNPAFRPPTREAQVFHHMAGHILINASQKRLVEMDGRLIREVKFFWGLLGHLNKGGTFRVRQTDLGSGHWQLSRLRVNMHGVALFFKTIGVQENEHYEDFHMNPPGTTLSQAVAQLEHASPSPAASGAGNR